MTSIACTLVKNAAPGVKKLVKITYKDLKDLHEQLEKAARDKLKVKKPILYVNDVPLRGATITKGVVVTVCSDDEKPVVKRAAEQQPVETTVNRSSKIVPYGDDTAIDPVRITQLDSIIKHADVQSIDVYPAVTEKYPRGIVVNSTAVHPELIGDIGNGISIFRTSLRKGMSYKRFQNIQRNLKDYKFGTQSEGWGGEKPSWMIRHDNSYGTWDPTRGDMCALYCMDIASQKLHHDNTEWNPNRAYLVVRSGSRTLSADLLKRYNGKTEAYMQYHNLACEWARGNRTCIANQYAAIADFTLTVVHDSTNTLIVQQHKLYMHQIDIVKGLVAVIDAKKIYVVDSSSYVTEKNIEPETVKITLEKLE